MDGWPFPDWGPVVMNKKKNPTGRVGQNEGSAELFSVLHYTPRRSNKQELIEFCHSVCLSTFFALIAVYVGVAL